jgi:hypothetical protein
MIAGCFPVLEMVFVERDGLSAGRRIEVLGGSGSSAQS